MKFMDIVIETHLEIDNQLGFHPPTSWKNKDIEHKMSLDKTSGSGRR